nr:S-adenosylmethionine decarboxylase [uncultured Rhodoferax sp.]
MGRLHIPLQFEHFGEHITIDGYLGDRHLLNVRENVKASIDELPNELGMKKLSSPEVYFAKGNDVKDPGVWSGFVVIEESHISVHTFTYDPIVFGQYNEAKLDVTFEFRRAEMESMQSKEL